MGVGSIDESEVTKFIRDSHVGVLALVDKDKPYAVPLEYYFDGKTLHFVISPRKGRKINCIENNANACFVIYESRHEEPEKAAPCRSVIIEGQVTLEHSALRMDVRQIGNWKCPPARFATCHVR